MSVHIYQGFCPDALDPDALDPNCPACRAIGDGARVPELQAENARLLAANEQAADELAEALYNLRLMTTQADANYKRAKDAEEQLRKYQIVTVARRCSDSDRDCDGDGSGPGCENAVVWEIQAMDDSGSHYAYVCAEHLSDYQKWAHDDGRLPMVFELADEE